MFGIQKEIDQAVLNAPKNLIHGIVTLVTAPGVKAVEFWNKLTPEDQALFEEAAISGLRLAARATIAADKGGKVSF